MWGCSLFTHLEEFNMPFRVIRNKNQFSCLILVGVLGLFPILTLAESPPASSDPAFQQAVEQVVEQYLLTHPEVIEQTLQTLQAKREAEERDRVRQIIATKQVDLLNDPASPVSGNPKGDVTVVEFFDYRCGYCKRVAGTVTQLQQDDPDVRIVIRWHKALAPSGL
jgi:protein-disulfide isomerase